MPEKSDPRGQLAVDTSTGRLGLLTTSSWRGLKFPATARPPYFTTIKVIHIVALASL